MTNHGRDPFTGVDSAVDDNGRLGTGTTGTEDVDACNGISIETSAAGYNFSVVGVR
jgi:hypothetical protein